VSERQKDRKWDWYLGGVIFLLMITRASAFGFEYWPQLDDYIQHHNYASGFTFSELQQLVGVLDSRPLAGILDYYVWTPLFDHMILGVAIISAIYAVTVVLMKRLMERYFPVGPMFCVIMALLPLGVEGTYWMSASTRVVCGMFCAVLAAGAFGRWLDSGKGRWALAFGVLIVLPFGFYEQAAVLAMTLVLGMGILELGDRWKRSLLALWSVPAAAVYMTALRLLSGDSVYAGRAELMPPTSDYYWDTFLPDILGQIKMVFLEGNFYTLAKGFVRSARLILSGELALWAIVVLLLSLLFGWTALRLPEHKGATHTAQAVLVGILLTIAPLTPFLVLANPWFSLRGAVTSFPGIALVCDAVLMILWRLLSVRREGIPVLAAAAALVFCVAGASEIGDYRDTYRNDQAIAQLTADTLKTGDPEAKQVGILGLEASFLPNQNFFWHEHIHGCTESDWAFNGLLSYAAGQGSALPSVTPLPTDPIYRKWNQSANRPERFEALYWYDRQAHSLVPVALERTGEHDFTVLTHDGAVIGRIWEEEEGIGYFRLS